MSIGGFSPGVGRFSQGPVPQVIKEGYDAATKTETIKEENFPGKHKETFWDSLEAKGAEKLVIYCIDGKTVEYEKGFFTRLLETKPELADLTQFVPVKFSDQSERMEPKAKLCMCGTTIKDLFKTSTGEKVYLPIVTPEDFQGVLHAIENEAEDIGTCLVGVQGAMDYLGFHPVSLPEGVHGKKDWNARGVDVGHVPPPPKELLEALNQTCPIAKDRSKMIDTHVILWMPPALNGESMTVNSLKKMATADAFGEKKMPYRMFVSSVLTDEVVNQPLAQGYWFALYKQPVEGGRSFAVQKQYIKDHCDGYEVPKVREVIAASVMQYGCSGEKKERILDNESDVCYSRCEELIDGKRVIVGALASSGLNMYQSADVRDNVGVCPVRRFF